MFSETDPGSSPEPESQPSDENEPAGFRIGSDAEENTAQDTVYSSSSEEGESGPIGKRGEEILRHVSSEKPDKDNEAGAAASEPSVDQEEESPASADHPPSEEGQGAEDVVEVPPLPQSAQDVVEEATKVPPVARRNALISSNQLISP